MKRNIILLNLVVVFALTLSVAYAGSAKSMIVNVPFEFYIQDQILPAGEYRFEMSSGAIPTGSIVFVRTGEGKGISILLTRSSDNNGSLQSHLLFNQYEEKYFLSSVSVGSFKARVATSKLEKELRAANKAAHPEMLIAQR